MTANDVHLRRLAEAFDKTSTSYTGDEAPGTEVFSKMDHARAILSYGIALNANNEITRIIYGNVKPTRPLVPITAYNRLPNDILETSDVDRRPAPK